MAKCWTKKLAIWWHWRWLTGVTDHFIAQKLAQSTIQKFGQTDATKRVIFKRNYFVTGVMVISRVANSLITRLCHSFLWVLFCCFQHQMKKTFNAYKWAVPASFFVFKQLYRIDFSGIQTWIVGVECYLFDYTTTAKLKL